MHSLVLSGPDPSHPDSTPVQWEAESLMAWGIRNRQKRYEAAQAMEKNCHAAPRVPVTDSDLIKVVSHPQI